MKLNLGKTWLQAGVSVTTFMMGSSVFAQTLTNMSNTVTQQAGSLGQVLTVGSYLGGVGLTAGGVMKLKAHAENPQTSLAHGIGRVAAGGALLALPTVATAMMGGFGGQGSSMANLGQSARF